MCVCVCLCLRAYALHRLGFNRFLLEGFRVKTVGVRRVLDMSAPNLQDSRRMLLREGQGFGVEFGFRYLRHFA